MFRYGKSLITDIIIISSSSNNNILRALWKHNVSLCLLYQPALVDYYISYVFIFVLL